jgi:hypothetical protein
VVWVGLIWLRIDITLKYSDDLLYTVDGSVNNIEVTDV